MSIITTIGLCKQKMSRQGWQLFCQHKKADTLEPYDPSNLTDSEEVLLSNMEALQYDYGRGCGRGVTLARISIFKMQGAIRHCAKGVVRFSYVRLFLRDDGLGWIEQRHRFAFGSD